MNVSSDCPPPLAGPRIWRAGTLVYTAGGLSGLFFWLLLGDFAWSMRDRSIWPMASWYLDDLHVPSWAFGILVSSFPAFVALILGPIISVMSDRCRSRWGRRIPLLFVTTPLAGAGMFGLAVTPWLSRLLHGAFPHLDATGIALACFGVFWTAFELGTAAGQAVFGGLVNDVVPREFLGRFYGLFRAVSLIDGMIFNFWIMGLVPAYFTLIMVLVTTFYVLAFMAVCFRIKEGQYPPPEKPSASDDVLERVTAEIATYVRECFGKSYYVLVFLMMMVAALTFSPVNIFSIPYVNSLGVSMDAYGKSLTLTYFISLCLSFVLGWMADLFHPLRMAMVTLAGYAVVTLLGTFFATTPMIFLAMWVLHGVLSGSYFTGAASLAQRLFPHEKFAQYASASGVFISIGNIFLAPIVGGLIDATGHQYRYTFLVGCGLALIALGLAVLVYRKFRQLGGDCAYVAPE